MNVAKVTGMPVLPNLGAVDDLPYTISFAIAYRAKINSLQELPKDKRPPKNLWDKPYKLEEFLDKAFDVKGSKEKDYIEFNTEEVD